MKVLNTVMNDASYVSTKFIVKTLVNLVITTRLKTKKTS